jgi:DNA-binding SARP family transcriptional activator
VPWLPPSRFRDLGALQVERDGQPVPIAGARLAAALPLLLIHADRVVGPDALAEAMWGGQAAPRSSSTLDSHV